MNEPPAKIDPAPAWGLLTVEQFCTDPVAVLEWRKFLATDTGQKLAAVVRGADPILALTSQESGSPAMIRGASRMEGEAAETLLGKAVGHKAVETLLFRRLTTSRTEAEPKSKRAGRRDIAPAPAVVP